MRQEESAEPVALDPLELEEEEEYYNENDEAIDPTTLDSPIATTEHPK